MAIFRFPVAWVFYYAISLAATVLLIQSRPVEAHGQGCCIDPCTTYEGCDCPENLCRGPDTNIQHYYDPACELPKKSGVCRAGICWWYTDNGGIGEPCEFLCCNDDFAHCY